MNGRADEACAAGRDPAAIALAAARGVSREPGVDVAPDGDEWTRAMRAGDFAAAWRISDEMLKRRSGQPCWHWPRHLQHVWDGTLLAGRRVLVRCYHGLGDTVQFVRFVPQLVATAREVTLWAQPALLPLLRSSPASFGRLLPLHDGAPDCEYDVDVELMELPHALRTTLATLPANVPYLSAPPEARFQRKSERLAVGLVWRSGDWDERRSICPAAMACLFEVDGVSFHWLQDAGRAEKWPLIAGEPWCPEPVTALAAAIARLDLVITVDSLPAHLAGALGVPTWTLLPAECDWRWMIGREDSPWYPTMRLFRQQRAGDWASVIERVKRELVALAAGDGRRS